MNQEDNLERYLSEIKEIRGLLKQNEDGGYVVWWVYIIWAAVCVSCSMIHLFCSYKTGISAIQAFKYIWLPGIIISGFFELIGWIIKMNHQNKPLFSGNMLRFFLLLMAFLVFLLVTYPSILKDPEISFSGFLYLTVALTFIVFARHTIDLFFPAGISILIIGLLLYFTDISTILISCSAGIVSGVILFAGGIIARKLEKNNE